MTVEFLPPRLLVPEAEDEVITLIRQLPIPPRLKKQSLFWWAQFVGVVLTKEVVDKLFPDIPPEQRP